MSKMKLKPSCDVDEKTIIVLKADRLLKHLLTSFMQ